MYFYKHFYATHISNSHTCLYQIRLVDSTTIKTKDLLYMGKHKLSTLCATYACYFYPISNAFHRIYLSFLLHLHSSAQRFTFVYVFCMKIISHCCLHYYSLLGFFFFYFLSKFFFSNDTMSEIYFCHICCFYATSIFTACSKRCCVCEVSPQIYLNDVSIKVISCVT